MAPGSTVAAGPTVTKYEMRVDISLLGSGVEVPDSEGDVVEAADLNGDADRLELGWAPITAFSLIMQLSLTVIGPSYA